MIGFVMLAGIIVNNGIVLVDTINQLRESGYEFEEAILTAGTMRVRPILMTALTTILGLSTMAIGLGQGADDAADGDRYDRWFDLWNFTNIISGSMYLWTLQ